MQLCTDVSDVMGSTFFVLSRGSEARSLGAGRSLALVFGPLRWVRQEEGHTTSGESSDSSPSISSDEEDIGARMDALREAYGSSSSEEETEEE